MIGEAFYSANLFELFSFYFKYKKYEEVFYLSCNNFNERENFYQSFE